MKINGLLFLGIMCFANVTFPSGRSTPVDQLVNADLRMLMERVENSPSSKNLAQMYRVEQQEKYRKVQGKIFPLAWTASGCALATAGCFLLNQDTLAKIALGATTLSFTKLSLTCFANNILKGRLDKPNTVTYSAFDDMIIWLGSK